jgi:hypothetical protein
MNQLNVQKAERYFQAAAVHLRFGRHERADHLIRLAWERFADGQSFDAASESDVRAFSVLGRIWGVGATPQSALERIRAAHGK